MADSAGGDDAGLPLPLLKLLSDGRSHAGEWLARELGVTRAAVWKQARRLRAAKITVLSDRHGYRLAEPLQLLDDRAILRELDTDLRARIADLEVLAGVDSTNQQILRRIGRRPATGVGGALVCLAERQSAGRGRRGRAWWSPFGSNLYLTVGWPMAGGAATLAGLSLAVGACLAEALEAIDIQPIGLKWPNDLLVDGRKIGGILVELRGDALGPCWVVVGVGLNLNMMDDGQAIDQPWTSARRVCGRPVDRNLVAGRALQGLLMLLGNYEQDGFAAWQAAWQDRNLLLGRQVVVQGDGSSLAGCVLGVAADGALRLQTAAGEVRVSSGEVSVREALAAD
ncbi:MAG: biotin--[acetyl-CoA-carboxylase] ligase [Pseudomonadales bacterium]|nr:biotin--[acetyl-CoA-carboxylase] ligase [Pseudomonadales bacterium]